MFYNIKTLAEKTGLSRRTIRYYYTEEHLNRIAKINAWRSQGTPLEKIREILEGKIPMIVRSEERRESIAQEAIFSSHWTRVRVNSGIELHFRTGALSKTQERKIEDFILSVIRENADG